MVLSVKKTAKLLRLRLLLVYLHLLYTLPFWGQHVASYIAIRYVSCCASNQLVLDVLPQITTCGWLPTSNRFHQTAFWTPLAVQVTSPQSLQVGNSTDIFSGYIPFWISLTQVSNVVFRNPMLLKWEQVLPLSYLKQQRWHVGIAGSLWCGLSCDNSFSRNQWRYGGERGPWLRQLQRDSRGFEAFYHWPHLCELHSLWSGLWVGSRTEGNDITWHTLYCIHYTQHSTLCVELTRVPCTLSVRKSFWSLLRSSKCQQSTRGDWLLQNLRVIRLPTSLLISLLHFYANALR